MIMTVTLNVSVDKAYKIEGTIVPGTVSRVVECKNTAGGKGLNVAKVVKLCNEEVLATGIIGGFNGDYVTSLLDEKEIAHSFSKANHETRSCINILGEDLSSTEFLEPGQPICEDEWMKFLEHYKSLLSKCKIITMSGSAPKGLPDNVYQELIRLAKEKGIPVILDTSGNYLLEGIKEKSTMIKPNEEELETLFEKKMNDINDLIESGKQLLQQGIASVVISLGGDGALLITKNGVFQGKPPKIKVVNTVGCGDSMVAAFAVSMCRKMKEREALAYAIAVSAANAMNMGTGEFRTEDFLSIEKQVEVMKLE